MLQWTAIKEKSGSQAKVQLLMWHPKGTEKLCFHLFYEARSHGFMMKNASWIFEKSKRGLLPYYYKAHVMNCCIVDWCFVIANWSKLHRINYKNNTYSCLVVIWNNSPFWMISVNISEGAYFHFILSSNKMNYIPFNPMLMQIILTGLIMYLRTAFWIGSLQVPLNPETEKQFQFKEPNPS